MAFDFGTKRIGIAIGQELTGTARGLTTLKTVNNKPDWEAIRRLIAEWHPVILIVGLPLNMDGTEHDMTKAARRFGNQLQTRYNLPIEMFDERLTSLEAEETLKNRQRARQNKAEIDMIAAQIILQGWLDTQQR